MKSTIIGLLVIVVGLTTLFNCCKKDDDIPYDPSNPILGKWEIIEMGNWPNMEPVKEPLAYEEYLPDSILREFEYETQICYSKKKYWINDSSLFKSIRREDGFNLTFEYKYIFFNNNNKLRIEATSFMIFNTSIYKRIN